ncbi:MAG TPA: hypothetical protein PL196_04615 [Burkholderiaceae bacterium]|nr:hypothetical protein [Burkholderiaceae bacterium]
MIAFLAGVVCHQVALNRALGFGLADAPVTELRVPAPYPVRAKPAPVAAAPRQHVVKSVVGDTSASGSRVSALTSEVDATNGLVFWTGRVTNATETAVDAARMTLEARDAAGALVATDTALLQPSRLPVGESAVMQLRVPDDPAIRRWALRAEWLQPTRQDLLDSESRPGRLATSAGF